MNRFTDHLCTVLRLHTVLRLSRQEQCLFLKAWWLLAWVPLLLTLLPLPRILDRIRRKGALPRRNVHAHIPLPRIAWLVEKTARHHLIRTTCLTEALTLAWILAQEGLASDLRIGVSRNQGVLTAHAWLERDGQVVYGQTTAREFHPLTPTGGVARDEQVRA